MLRKDGESRWWWLSALVVGSHFQVLIQQYVCMFLGERLHLKIYYLSRNGDGSHTDDGILEVLQLYRNAQVSSIFKTLLLDVDFIVCFEHSNCCTVFHIV